MLPRTKEMIATTRISGRPLPIVDYDVGFHGLSNESVERYQRI